MLIHSLLALVMQLKFQFSSLQLNISFPLRAHLSSWLGSGLWGTALSQPIPALGSSQSTGRVRHTQKPFPRGVGSAVTKGVLAGWSGALPTVVGGVGVGDRQNRPFFFFKIFLVWTIFKVFIEFVTILLLFYVLVFWLRGMLAL